MFRPRHAYRAPITNRYRGKAKGCPVFNNLSEISSPMVEQHDECLECLAKLKNRSMLYKTLADNNKPSNNVIKKLQRLSSSASNNRLKTCLQFLIIRVNEKNSTPKQIATSTNGNTSPKSTVHLTDIIKDTSSDYVDANQTHVEASNPALKTTSTKISNRRQKSRQQPRQNQQKLNQLASPPQDQVSSTQDQIQPTHGGLDCRTSPLMIDSCLDDRNHEEQMVDNSATTSTTTPCNKDIDEDASATSMTSSTTMHIKTDEKLSHHQHQCSYMSAQSTQSSPPVSSCNGSSSPLMTSSRTTTPTNQLSSASSTSTSTATTSTSPLHIIDYDLADKTKSVTNDFVEKFVTKSNKNDEFDFKDQIKATSLDSNGSNSSNSSISISSNISSNGGASSGSSSNGSTPTIATNIDGDKKKLPNQTSDQQITKRRRVQNSLSSDHETSSLASWSMASYGAGSPLSPMSSASSTTSPSSDDSMDSESMSYCSASSTCSSAYTHSSSPQPPPCSSSPLLIPEFNAELRGPRLKLSEEKLRKIKKRPVLCDDYLYATERAYDPHRKPTISKIPPNLVCGLGTAQNTDLGSSASSCISSSLGSCFGLSATSLVMHTFQAPPTFVNNLKPCNLPKPKSQEPSSPSSTPPVPQVKVELINCAICGIKEKPPKICKIFGQNSCLLCTEFFADFLKSPKQYFCAHDGDCLMTFDSRCQACWIKICLQKFDVDEGHRKIGEKYSPKLLLSPNVSLITIDTSVPDW